MHTSNQPSSMLQAVDLVRMNVDQMGLLDLEAHAATVLDTIAALNAYINSGSHKSQGTSLNALRRVRNLCMHLARVRGLILAYQSARAVVQAMPSTFTPCMRGGPGKARRSRVVRALPSADNAASGHIQILSNDPQGNEAKVGCGGEAKEAGARLQSGEASLQAKR